MGALRAVLTPGMSVRVKRDHRPDVIGAVDDPPLSPSGRWARVKYDAGLDSGPEVYDVDLDRVEARLSRGFRCYIEGMSNQPSPKMTAEGAALLRRELKRELLEGIL